MEPDRGPEAVRRRLESGETPLQTLGSYARDRQRGVAGLQSRRSVGEESGADAAVGGVPFGVVLTCIGKIAGTAISEPPVGIVGDLPREWKLDVFRSDVRGRTTKSPQNGAKGRLPVRNLVSTLQ